MSRTALHDLMQRPESSSLKYSYHLTQKTKPSGWCVMMCQTQKHLKLKQYSKANIWEKKISEMLSSKPVVFVSTQKSALVTPISPQLQIPLGNLENFMQFVHTCDPIWAQGYFQWPFFLKGNCVPIEKDLQRKRTDTHLGVRSDCSWKLTWTWCGSCSMKLMDH